MKKIGICGGSFDPVHFGHLALAKQALSELALSEVIFMPANIQPFKLYANPASVDDRLNMLKLAIENENRFSISTLEIERDGISYTYDTIMQLKENSENIKYSASKNCNISSENNIKYYFILGADSFIQIEEWYKAEKLLSICNLAVGIRPGSNMKKIEERYKSIKGKYKTDMIFLNNKELEISSTAIKEKILKGETVSGLLPEKVIDYIYDRKLYR